MQLWELCKGVEYTLIQGSEKTHVKDIVYDSKKLTAGVMFVCIAGAVTDGHRYIPEAVEKGASVIVVEGTRQVHLIPEGITVIRVDSTRRALAFFSAQYFGHPADKLITIGITGTKGKTTISYMIKQIAERARIRTGLIGTIAAETGARKIPAVNTTPESYEIHRYMAEMVSSGCRCMVMEVSSQGLKLDRTAGIIFDYAIFTNLSADHIGPNEHENFEEYLACKRMLFRQCETGIVNIDDEHTEEILEGHTCSVMTLSTQREAELTARDIEFLKERDRLGMSFNVCGLMEGKVRIGIPGRFSVYNALAAIAVCRELGISGGEILSGLEKVHVKGRVELLPVSEDFSVIIDYAHNDVRTRSVLETLRRYGPARLTAVFGCGGNRSRVRRYDIGREAGRLADLSILTSDNPRFESVADINDDIKKGIAESGGRYMEIEDRKEAIAYAVTHACRGEMIVLLGKGHEDYIETAGVKRHFSEHEAVKEIVSEIKSGARMMEEDLKLL